MQRCLERINRAGRRAAVVDHISDENPQAAQDLKDEIEAKVNALPAHPKKYARSKRATGYRQLTARSEYLVH